LLIIMMMIVDPPFCETVNNFTELLVFHSYKIFFKISRFLGLKFWGVMDCNFKRCKFPHSTPNPKFFSNPRKKEKKRKNPNS
jgi:hypothetical protein